MAKCIYDYYFGEISLCRPTDKTQVDETTA
uniref:Uncharacterized protein n=1 Tax=Anguilla anguilla TaxID=7936 RepID=A0A0E9SXG6_ANGAN